MAAVVERDVARCKAAIKVGRSMLGSESGQQMELWYLGDVRNECDGSKSADRVREEADRQKLRTSQCHPSSAAVIPRIRPLPVSGHTVWAVVIPHLAIAKIRTTNGPVNQKYC